MVKQKSSGPQLILQHAVEVKKDIQSEFHKLFAILKEREHDLCLEVDQKCLELLQEAKDDEDLMITAGLGYANEQDFLISKLKFTGDLDWCHRELKQYGGLLKIACQNTTFNIKTNNRSKDTKNIFKGGNIKPEDTDGNESCVSNDSFEVIEQVYGFKETMDEEEYISVEHIPNGYEQLMQNMEEKMKIDQVEGKASCVESFENVSLSASKTKIPKKEYEQLKQNIKEKMRIDRVEGKKEYEQYLQHIQETTGLNPVGGNFNCAELLRNDLLLASEMELGILIKDSVASKARLAASPDILLRANLSNKRTQLCSSLANQSCTNRSPRKNEWLANTVQDRTEMSSDRIQASPCNKSEISASPTSSKSYSGNPAEVANEDSPQIIIKTCFGAYLKQNDLKLWLHPNHSSNETDSTPYGEWVAKDEDLF